VELRVRHRAALFGLAWFVVAAAACSGEGSLGSGTVVVSGSSTVEPISVAVAESYNDHIDGTTGISVEGPGTGDGFKKFCAGEIDVNDASSKIREEQIAECDAAGIDFVELRIGNDGITMLTSTENDLVECLDIGNLYGLVGPESQGVDNWADADDLAAQVGGSGGLPDASLQITGPGEESGTYTSFVELALEDIADERGEPAETRPDYTSSPNDNVIIQGVQGFDTSLGWVGFAFASEATDVKTISIDGGEGCIEPTPESIADGSYPLSRPLFIYVNAAHAEEKDSLVAFIDYFLGDAVGSVSDVGYVDLSAADLAETRQRWADRTTGAAEES
jgi:phosphate transport system substrate-binding protein